MANHPDGTVVVDTELDTNGFKAGSKELMSATKSLSAKVEALGPTLKRAVSGSTSAMSAFESRAETLGNAISEIEAKMKSLGDAKISTDSYKDIVAQCEKAEQALFRLFDRQDKMRDTGVETSSKAWRSLQYDIRNAEAELERVERKKKAMENSGTAFRKGVDTEEYRQLSETLGTAKQKMSEFNGEAERAAQEQPFRDLLSDIENVDDSADKLATKFERLRATNVPQNSSQWANLAYSIQSVLNQLAAYESELISLHSVGTVDDGQFEQTSAAIASARERLQDLSAGTAEARGEAHGLRLAFLQVGKVVGSIAASIGGSLVKAVKSAASHMAKMLTHSRSMKNQFSGLISGAKRFALGLLGARGAYSLLRKAVSAYMSENQELANTLSNCWSKIGNALGPIITRLVNLIFTAVAYFGSFLSLLGITGRTASNTIGKAGDDAHDEAERLKKQLASFDELNIMRDNDSDSGGNTDVPSQPIDANLPDWIAMLIEQIRAGNWAEAATILTEQLNGMIAGVDWVDIGDAIGYYLNGALAFLATAILTFDWYNLGSNLASGINHIIDSVDWGNLGVVLGANFVILIEGLGGFFATLDWVKLGNALSDAFMGLWNAIDWTRAAKTLSDGVIGTLTTITTAISNTDWEQIGRDIGDFIAAIDWNGIFKTTLDAIGTAIQGIGDAVEGLSDEIPFIGVISDSLLWCYNNVLKPIADWVIDDAAPAVLETLATAAETLTSVLELLKPVGEWLWENFLQPIGEWTGQVFVDTFTTINNLLSKLNELLQGNTTFGEFLDDLSLGETILLALGTAIGVVCAAVAVWNVVGAIATAVTTALGVAVSILTSPITLVIAAIAALIAIGVLLYQNWDEITARLSELWGEIKSLAVSVWSAVKDFFVNLWNGIKSTVTSVWNDIKTFLSNLWSGIKNTATSVWTGLKNAVMSVVNGIKSGVTSAFNAVKSFIINCFNKIKTTVTNIWNGIWGTIKGVINGILGGIESMVNGVIKGLNSMINALNKLSFEVPDWVPLIGGKTFGFNLKTISEISIPRLADGGLVRSGQLFQARESGPELIGSFGGKSAVMNNDQIVDSVSRGVADAVAEEMNGIDRSIRDVSEVVENVHFGIVDKLQAIAQSVAFRAPAIANGLTPYKIAAAASGSIGDDVSSAIEASNDELASVITQVVANATTAIVTAIQNYSSTTVNLDKSSLAESVISEINRKTRMAGRSPLLT